MNTIYMGYDPREDLAYQVAEHSIRVRTGEVMIKPLVHHKLSMLKRPIEMKEGKFWCPISQAPMATLFAISRFCVPFLKREGFALFMDCDVILRTDVDELFQLADPSYAVQVVKHNHHSGQDTKMDGQVQSYYNRKNWSSVILWNCEHPAHNRLTEEALNTWPGRDLHAFKWLQDDEIGELPRQWNWLVGVTMGDPGDAKLLHYTLGGPWFRDWKGGDADSLWILEKTRMDKSSLPVPTASHP